MSEVLGDVKLEDVLMAWAQRDGMPLEEHRHEWRRLLAAVTTAGVTGCVQVRVFPDDIPTIRALGARPLQRFSANLLGDHTGYPAAAFARSLAERAEPVDGPFVAVGRTGAGPFTILDGHHRMAAWVAHVSASRGYPLVVSVVLTERPVAGFEILPEH